MATTTQSYGFPVGLKKDLDEVFDVHFGGQGDQYKEVFKVDDMDDAYEDDVQIQMPDEIAEASEGGMYPRVEIENVRSKRYLASTHKAEIKITQEALEDLKYKKMFDAAEGLAIAMHRTVERKGASFFYLGFTSEQSPDGVSVFNDSHSLNNVLAGAKFTAGDNKGTGALNATNLKAGRTQMKRTPDEHGSPAPYYPDQLIVTPDLEWTGLQLVQSIQEPGTANNDKNVAARGLKLVVLDYLMEAPTNDTTMWFLRDSKMAKNKFRWRLKPEKEVVREEATGDYLYRVRFRIVRGCSDWRGLYGSTGAS